MKFQKYLILIIISIMSVGCTGSVTHRVIDSFDNGTIKTISIFKGLSKIQEIKFSNDGNILSRNFYRNNCLFGRWISGEFFEEIFLTSNYYGNGVLKSRGYIVNDNLHGHWAYYNRHGDLESNRFYFQGEPVGDWYSYHDGYMEVEHHEYIKGNGNWVEYYNADENESGESQLKIKETSFFNNKKLSGVYEYYYKNGNIKISGYYSEGKKNGEWNYYNKQGKLIKVENYNKGALDGNFSLFFNDGLTEKLIGKYKDNKRIDTWFWFFDIDKKSNHKVNYSK